MTMVIGLLFVAASFLVALREILLRPSSLHYPKAPFWLRSTMFAWLLTLFFVGAVLIFAAIEAKPVSWEPLMLLIAAATMLQCAAMTGNILRQRYPPHFWKRINRFLELADCGAGMPKRATLGMLELQGVRVVGPREGPTVLS